MTVEGRHQASEDELRIAVSRRIVSMLKEYFGRGPINAKTYYAENLIVVVIKGGFTPFEATLFEGGRAQEVKNQRSVFTDVMRPRYTEAIQELTGRRVLSYMSTSDQEADISAEIFVLEPVAD